ncbi:cyclic nucleotide-binding domain-containing protein [Chitinophaga pendula]|uniref:Crp/Fnr family transcriptional regulator n=1 Tax=Chitinophaga TaxID=79328 RepID=UPI000BB04DF1|nr:MULTISPECIES: cyclic nucleotide-binding domain-containing protein [Chitinophaga]ASZ14086.1 cyclic nucleotide-binding protein [Chitinophaga sp. MD30]UCJ08281.1 cyclic nucleotide-binding domain-containing protein [Chitinophaga pendula]
MISAIDQERYIHHFRTTLESYTPISASTWLAVAALIRFQEVKREEILLREGQIARQMHFICKGILRAYLTDDNGNFYNKNIFCEGRFAASKASLLRQAPSQFSIDVLEDAILINLDFSTYRHLIQTRDDLKDFYIAYLEKNWVIEREQREISLVMEDATTRYLKLLQQYPDIDKRVNQFHIAAHLGVTPTQLSRIRSQLKKNR